MKAGKSKHLFTFLYTFSNKMLANKITVKRFKTFLQNFWTTKFVRGFFKTPVHFHSAYVKLNLRWKMSYL